MSSISQRVYVLHICMKFTVYNVGIYPQKSVFNCVVCIEFSIFCVCAGGKKCLVCGERVAHDKWNISPRLAEQRWAHHQARLREIDEVVDFLS